MIRVNKIWTETDAIWIETSDGCTACEKFADYPRLKNATEPQLKNFYHDEIGIHWPDLDEDLCFEGFFNHKNKNFLYRLFMEHPELNASAIARRMNIPQSLFAQYVSGSKKPSQKRFEEIISTIQQIGEELAGIKQTGSHSCISA